MGGGSGTASPEAVARSSPGRVGSPAGDKGVLQAQEGQVARRLQSAGGRRGVGKVKGAPAVLGSWTSP